MNLLTNPLPRVNLWINYVLIAEVETVGTITKAVAATDDIDRICKSRVS